MSAALKMEPWQLAWINHPNDPLKFATDVLGFLPPGVPNPSGWPQLEAWQVEALTAIGKHDRLSIRAGHGVGKTAFLVIVILWFMATRFPFKIPITANSQDQLRDVVWPELRKWSSRLPEAMREQLDIQAERIQWRAAPEAAFAVARTASKDNPEALQGFHEDNLLFVLEEASGIEDIVFEVARGALSTSGAKIVMVANPTQSEGYFYRSQTTLADRWYTMRVSSEDVPRARGHIDEIIADYGRESNQYRVRVLGEFPLADDDAVIPLHLVDAAIARRGRVARVDGIAPVWGVDVAWMGSDRSALAKRQSNELLEPVKWWSGNDPHQTAQRIFLDWQDTEEEDRPASIMVDAIGMGAATYLKLRELGLPARMVNVGEAAAADERYMRLRDELWFRGRTWLQDSACILPSDNALKAELVAVKYAMTPNGKIKVESKDDMRERGLRSPDLADAFLLTFAGGEHKRAPRLKEKRYARRPTTSRSWMAA
jgi:phage terminase large subunit